MPRITDLEATLVEQLERAGDEARRLGHGYIGTEHILIVIAGSGNGRGAALLREQGITAEALRGVLGPMFEEGNWNRYIPDEETLGSIGVDLRAVRAQAEAEFGDGAVPMRTGSPGFTARSMEIIDRAVSRGSAAGRRANEDDVLGSILADTDSVGVKILARAGADLEELRQAVK